MTEAKRKALQAAAVEFERTTHGTQDELDALEKWRMLCEPDSIDDFEAISAYQRRNREADAAKKKAARGKYRY